MESLTRQVQDLPRQYRRTNRDWPSSASGFMTRIAGQLVDLAHLWQRDILAKPRVAASPDLVSQITAIFEQLVLKTTQL